VCEEFENLTQMLWNFKLLQQIQHATAQIFKVCFYQIFYDGASMTLCEQEADG